ncbi:MAG: hypothetical protein ACR2H1_02865 [Limisphaerales bacterium]
MNTYQTSTDPFGTGICSRRTANETIISSSLHSTSFRFFSFLRFLNLPMHLPFLMMLRVGAGLPDYRNVHSLWVNKISVTAFATTVHKSGFFPLGNHL